MLDTPHRHVHLRDHLHEHLGRGPPGTRRHVPAGLLRLAHAEPSDVVHVHHQWDELGVRVPVAQRNALGVRGFLHRLHGVLRVRDDERDDGALLPGGHRERQEGRGGGDRRAGLQQAHVRQEPEGAVRQPGRKHQRGPDATHLREAHVRRARGGVLPLARHQDLRRVDTLQAPRRGEQQHHRHGQVYRRLPAAQGPRHHHRHKEPAARDPLVHQARR
mmetsp:Transcript_12381/g.35065  ORF Transcript_12381/g.35065 Transcript_12381/m.35065 type:complete len:217 (+) Transcript_12381:658-1308(+)